MPEFVNMWKNYVNFSDRTNKRGYWMAVLFLCIASVAATILDNLIGSGGIKTVTTGTSVSITTTPGIISSLFALATFLPGLALSVRRLRDVGKKWTSLFWSLLPLVGWIILIVQLCKPSVPDDGTPVV